jgi:hypothetical protein
MMAKGTTGAKRLLRIRPQRANTSVYIPPKGGRFLAAGQSVERSPEKAGVGGSIPSLATPFQQLTDIPKAGFIPFHSKNVWSAETRISDGTWYQDRSGRSRFRLLRRFSRGGGL